MNLSERDKLYNWHPYTQHKTAKHFPAIVKGEGALLWDENNKEYKDDYCSDCGLGIEELIKNKVVKELK